MKKIIKINFVSNYVPNILLIADINNSYMEHRHLKHFKNTHNIYALIHNTDNHFAYYYDLPSHHGEIIDELNKYNLYNFTISSLSFGGLMAHYLIFHLPERVEKAFIHDHHWLSFQNFDHLPLLQNNINVSNWNIPKKCLTKILFAIHTDSRIKYKDSFKIFCNINYVFIFNIHTLIYKYPEEHALPLEYMSYFFNGFKLHKFWNKWYPKWMNNKHKFKTKWWAFSLFMYLFKRRYK